MRKDVLIARITFAILCLAIIGIIVSAATRISASRKEKKSAENTVEETTQSTEISSEIETETIEPIEPVVVYVKTTKSVNLRSAASTDSTIIRTLEAEEMLELISESDGWAEVIAGDDTGFVSMDYVEYVSDETTTVDNATGTESKVYKTTTDSVRMRSGAGTDSSIITTIPSGVTLEIISEENGWAEITYQGQTGYVSADYIQ